MIHVKDLYETLDTNVFGQIVSLRWIVKFYSSIYGKYENTLHLFKFIIHLVNKTQNISHKEETIYLNTFIHYCTW